jgi:hypothetical protein
MFLFKKTLFKAKKETKRLNIIKELTNNRQLGLFKFRVSAN